ncbi:MAG: hypothetical protein ACXWM9_13325 [Gemmatimonadaceae bacterium]
MSSQQARLNANQIRHVLSVMSQVESVLANIERLADSSDSPFAREARDLSVVERRAIQDLVARLRSGMAEVLAALGIPSARKDMSARWSIESALRVADVSFSDLGGRRLQGYGELDPVTADLVAKLSLELRRITEQGIFMLRQRS